MNSDDIDQQQILLEQFERRIVVYADELQTRVLAKRLTKHLAGLLLQKFGDGVREAAEIVLGEQATIVISGTTERLVAEIDPAWREHIAARTNMKPAGICEGLG